MRKETIIKYEKEFIAWCKGESVLLGAPTSMHDRTLIWREVRDFNDWKHLDTVYVLNDSYSIYRKALAEGKTLQYNFGNFGTDKKDFPDSWKDLDLSIGILADRACPENYRVKPEEPKFKVGDWVIHNGVAKRVTKAVDGCIDSLDNEVAVIMKEESLELWEPEGEKYFWYKNDLVRFHETQANLGLLLESARGCSYYPAEKNFEDYCEPYLGKLPSNLKQDSKNISVE